MEELAKDCRQAERGRKRWLEIKDEYKIDGLWYVVICPRKDKELCQLVLQQLPYFLERKYISKAMVIMEDSDRENMYIENKDITICFKQAGGQEIDEILKYYRLVQFEKNVVVVSLEEPYGTAGIIGKEGITLKDYVNDALLV